MDYYIDIRIRRNLEFSDPILMNEIYFRLHQALVRVGQGEVGVSFPSFAKTLGSCIRLHSGKLALERLMSTSWTNCIEDYILVSDINKIPDVVSYRLVRRVEIKSNTDRLLRRSVRKGWLTEEEANKRLIESDDKRTSLPYVKLKSLSTGQHFYLFIEHKEILSKPLEGEFSAYGLSSNTTIPWF